MPPLLEKEGRNYTSPPITRRGGAAGDGVVWVCCEGFNRDADTTCDSSLRQETAPNLGCEFAAQLRA